MYLHVIRFIAYHIFRARIERESTETKIRRIIGKEEEIAGIKRKEIKVSIEESAIIFAKLIKNPK